jgi:hypothetical protein
LNIRFFTAEQTQKMEGDFERLGDSFDCFDRRLALARFDKGKVAPIDLGAIRQLALRQIGE